MSWRDWFREKVAEKGRGIEAYKAAFREHRTRTFNAIGGYPALTEGELRRAPGYPDFRELGITDRQRDDVERANFL